MKKAATLGAGNQQMVYGYAIGLFSTGNQAKIIPFLEQFFSKYGNLSFTPDGLIAVCQDMKLNDKAAKYAAIRRNVYGY